MKFGYARQAARPIKHSVARYETAITNSVNDIGLAMVGKAIQEISKRNRIFANLVVF